MARGITVRKVLQIIPADGWWQVFGDKDSMIFEPLACWALVEFDYIKTPLAKKNFHQHVTGLSAAQLAVELVEISQERSKFLGYVHERDFEILGERLKPGVKLYHKTALEEV